MVSKILSGRGNAQQPHARKREPARRASSQTLEQSRYRGKRCACSALGRDRLYRGARCTGQRRIFRRFAQRNRTSIWRIGQFQKAHARRVRDRRRNDARKILDSHPVAACRADTGHYLPELLPGKRFGRRWAEEILGESKGRKYPRWTSMPQPAAEEFI